MPWPRPAEPAVGGRGAAPRRDRRRDSARSGGETRGIACFCCLIRLDQAAKPAACSAAQRRDRVPQTAEHVAAVAQTGPPRLADRGLYID